MSQTLYTSDYMSVIGEITEYKSQYTDWTDFQWARLNLHFCIQVNGKMKTFTHFLELVDTSTKRTELTPYVKSFDLKEYRVWYAIVETLGELGYPIWDYDRDSPLWMNFISEWIRNCTSELTDNSTYYR